MAARSVADRFKGALDDLRAVAVKVGAGGDHATGSDQAAHDAAKLRGQATLLQARWDKAATDDERAPLARLAVETAAQAHKDHPIAGDPPDWIADETMEVAERVYRAAMLDVDSAITHAAIRTKVAVAMPRFLMTFNLFRGKRGQIQARWEQAQARGERGKKDRVRVAGQAVRFALVVHEQLPGAPPAPEWLEQVNRRRAHAPKAPITVTGEIERTIRYVTGNSDDDEKKKTNWTAIALLAGAVILGAAWLRGRH